MGALQKVYGGVCVCVCVSAVIIVGEGALINFEAVGEAGPVEKRVS